MFHHFFIICNFGFSPVAHNFYYSIPAGNFSSKGRNGFLTVSTVVAVNVTFYGISFVLLAGIRISFKAGLITLFGDTDLFELLASSVLFVERELFLI